MTRVVCTSVAVAFVALTSLTQELSAAGHHAVVDTALQALQRSNAPQRFIIRYKKGAEDRLKKGIKAHGDTVARYVQGRSARRAIRGAEGPRLAWTGLYQRRHQRGRVRHRQQGPAGDRHHQSLARPPNLRVS